MHMQDTNITHNLGQEGTEVILEVLQNKRQRLSDVIIGNCIGEPMTLTPDATVTKALKIIDHTNRGAVLVLEKSGALVGILSERDIVRQMAKDGASVFDWPVEMIMTKAVMVESENTSCHDVLLAMTERRFRNMPVCREDETIFACVEILDIVNAKLSELTAANRKLLELLTKRSDQENLITPDTLIASVLKGIREKHIEYFIVRDDEKILGLITPDDLLKNLYRRHGGAKA
jgi:CBS domain-containing protein